MGCVRVHDGKSCTAHLHMLHTRLDCKGRALSRQQETPTHLNPDPWFAQVSEPAASEAVCDATTHTSTIAPEPSNASKPPGSGGFLRGLTTRKPKATPSEGQPDTRQASAAPLPPASPPSQSLFNRSVAAESLATAELPTATSPAGDGPPVPPLPVRRPYHATVSLPKGVCVSACHDALRKGTHR